MVKKIKVIRNQHVDPDHHQKLIISRRPLLPHACQFGQRPFPRLSVILLTSGVARNFQWGGLRDEAPIEAPKAPRGVGCSAPSPENFWIFYIKTVTFVHSGWHYLPCI